MEWSVATFRDCAHQGGTDWSPAVRDQRNCPFELNVSAQLLCSEVKWVNRKQGYCQKASGAVNVLLTSCNTARGSLRSQQCNGNGASSLAFWGITGVYPNSLARKLFKSKDAPSSRNVLAHRLNGSAGYLMPVYSPNLDSPLPQNAFTLSFKNFPLMTSKIILTIILSLILNLHQIVSNKLLSTWVRGEHVKTTFTYNLTRIKILFFLMKSPQKVQGWEGNVKIRCEITQGSLVGVCAAFCESLVIWIIFFFFLSGQHCTCLF